ncbi:glycerate kinase [Microbacterium sp. kSW2-24]|uniref:glycerate kinase n=1 Tax=Microbacterium galbinum TaxID=2851646 RepID=UPI001FFC6598|nr:glycerate kinase [Microbacterium galbinum]MCK2023997.1 glycerate kinase [Microbacterium galbinum]
MHTVVLAPDSFKGTIGAADVAAALVAGWGSVRPNDRVVLRPMADGGEGTVDAFAAAVDGAVRVPVRVTGPDGAPTDAAWLRLPATPDAPGGTGVVELASTSGIELLGERRIGEEAHTLGFGQAIAAALDAGVSRLVLGIGSSASTDGGTGMLTALGARFLDASGAPIAVGARGLAELASVDPTGLHALPPGGVLVLSDVTNPLVGPLGAAAVFGPQKGLTGDAIARADAGLARLASLLPVDPETPGAGAAGGTGFGLLAWGARLVAGSAEVGELVGLPGALAEASAVGPTVVITGEGAFDGQSGAGKVPSYVAATALGAGADALLVAGRIDADADTSVFAAHASLTELAGSGEAAMQDPARWLHTAGALLARSLG